MGGTNSGRRQGDGPSTRRGLKPVVGSGKPLKPTDMPTDVGLIWERLHALTSGVAYEQDSLAMDELAWLLWQQGKLRESIQKTTDDQELIRTSLAVGRAILSMLHQFGLTPRSRQGLLVPDRTEVDDRDDLERLMDERDS